MFHPHNPEYLTDERRAVVDDVCLYTVSETEHWDRVRKQREVTMERLHKAAVAAFDRFKASGDPADEAAYNEAFDRWIAA